MVISKHSVNRNFIFCKGQRPIHQANGIDLCTVCINSDRSAKIGFLLYIKLLVKRYALFFNGFFLRMVHLMLCHKVAIFNIVFCKPIVIGFQHTVICHKKTGDKTDRKDHQKKDHQIFSEISLYFPRQAL